jgi:HAMP domain-containing protein
MIGWGIRTRVLLLALVPSLVIALTLAGYLIYSVSADAERELVAYGRDLSRQLAAIAEFGAYSGDRAALRNIASAALDTAHVLAVTVYDADGLPITSSGSSGPRLSHLPPGEKPAALDADEGNMLFIAPILVSRLPTDDLLLGEAPPAQRSASQEGDEPPPLGWVMLKVSRAAMQQRKREAVFIALVSVTGILLLSGALAVWLGRGITRPILRLEDTVLKIQSGQLDVRVPTDSGGDLQRLEEGMNAMAEALTQNRQNLQTKIEAATRELQQKKDEAENARIAKSRFLAAASHDLRQPLHALSLFVSDLGRASETPAQHRLSRQIGDSVSSISQLLDTLLDISRLDLAEVVVEKQTIRLTDRKSVV